jgi:hypothetical protein
MGQEHNTLTLVELVGTELCRMNKRHSSLHAWASVKHDKTHTRKNTGMSLSAWFPLSGDHSSDI